MDYEKDFGNYVRIHKGSENLEGILLPSPEKGFVLLKLKNGYNVGVNKKDIVEVEVLKKIVSEKKSFKMKIDKNKKNIAMVILGGTIAARLNPGKGGVDFVENPSDLFEIYPEIFERANVLKIVNPFMKGSEIWIFGIGRRLPA